MYKLIYKSIYNMKMSVNAALDEVLQRYWGSNSTKLMDSVWCCMLSWRDLVNLNDVE